MAIAETFSEFFGELEAEFATRIITKMEYCKFTGLRSDGSDSDMILRAGKVPKYIYFAVHGNVAIFSTDGLDKYVDIEAGSVYGESFVLFGIPASYCFKYDIPRPGLTDSTSERDTKADMYKISAEDFMNVMKDYPTAYTIIKAAATTKRREYRRAKRLWIGQRKFAESRRDGTFHVRPSRHEGRPDAKMAQDH